MLKLVPLLLTLALANAQETPPVAKPVEPPAAPTATTPGSAAATTAKGKATPDKPAEPAAPTEIPDMPDDGSRVAVLGYHDFAENMPETAMRIHTSKFRKQMEAIRTLGIKVITWQEFVAWKKDGAPLPPKCILLTFDDGWKSMYTDAYPILKEYNYPFVLYLYKNYIDGGGKAMTTPMVQDMVSNGAAIGSHSVTHPYPATVKASMRKGPAVYSQFLHKEMGDSKTFLETKFPSIKVNSYAYPGGFHTPEMLTLSKELGYDYLFTVIPGKVKRPSINETLPRYMILGNYDRIFDMATNFTETGASAESAGLAAPAQKTPYPVTPESGAIINSRLPEISADLTEVPDLNPATLSMKIAGFGEVPATWSAETHKLTWHVNRKLHQLSCQVSVSWKDAAGKPVEPPLRWSFQLDREAAYLPDGE